TRLAATGSATTSMPSTTTRPLLGFTRVVSDPIVVVLPAPLGPSSPKTSPSGTENDTPATASRLAPAYVLRRSATSMIGATEGSLVSVAAEPPVRPGGDR